MHKPKDVFTTGQVAKICNVAPRTVSKWFDNGQLKGYRIPGSKDGRIPAEDLIAFMKSHGIPLNGLAGNTANIIILDTDTTFTDTLSQGLISLGGLAPQCVTTAFAAGLAIESNRPDLLIVDINVPGVQFEQLAQDIRRSENLDSTRLIATGNNLDEESGKRLVQAGYDSVLPKPFHAQQLLDTLLHIRAQRT